MQEIREDKSKKSVGRVLDTYGNNIAVQCSSCDKVFVLSSHLNKKNGRICPHCNTARAYFGNESQLLFDSTSSTQDAELRVGEILRLVKPLAAEFYQLTGKPLGVTGEIAEFVASEVLGLTLVAARTIGFDALRGTERIQIKGRAYDPDKRSAQRISRIKLDAPCDFVVLVLLNNATLEAQEIWEASYQQVCELLTRPGSRARERGALGVHAFKSIAKLIWSNNTNDLHPP